MARVHVLSAAPSDRDASPHGHDELDKLLELARLDRFGAHTLVDDPGDADLVLFVESNTEAGPYFERVVRSETYRHWRAKSYLYSSYDRIVPVLPGVFPSVERSWYLAAWTRSGGYLGVRETDDLHFEPDDGAPRPHLYSFIGSSATHPVRRELVKSAHPGALVIDTAGEGAGYAVPANRDRYRSSIASSDFVLCPRGGGAASFRLFETMMLGRCPVIISDQWVPPGGPAWHELSIRVAEGDVGRLAALLEPRRAEAARMGEAAREAWVDWFSETATFHRVVEWCLELDRFRADRTGMSRYRPYVQLLRPYHSARYAARRVGHGSSWRIPRPSEVGAALQRRRRKRAA